MASAPLTSDALGSGGLRPERQPIRSATSASARSPMIDMIFMVSIGENFRGPGALRARGSATLPRPYLLAGTVAFLLLSAAIPLLGSDLMVSNDTPHVLSLTHLAVLGWITMVMMGALHQLFPVALQARIFSARLGRWNFWLYAGSLSGFIPSFFFAWTPGMASFGSLLVLSVLVFIGNLLASYPSVRIWHPMAFYVLAGLIWLILTIGLGGAYALDWRFGWFPITDAMVAAHAHLGLAGWLSPVLMGVSYKLMAMFSLAHGHDQRLGIWNLGIWNAGLVGLTASLWLRPHSVLVTAFALWLTASAAIFVVDMARLLRHRRRRRLSLEQWHSFVSFASLLVAAGMGVVLAAGRPPTPTWTVAYGYAALIGWFGFAIVGKSYKIVPFLTWLRRYAAVAGAAPTPLLREMVDERLGWTAFWLLLVGYVGVLAGLSLANLPLIEVMGTGYTVGAAAAATNLARSAWPRRSEPMSQPARQVPT